MAKLNSTALPSSETFRTNGEGYTSENTVSPLMCGAKSMEIEAGISKIRQMLIGRKLMGAMG
ncbi:hypothetical protein [Profundibacter amoris]|uniref:Uncharacterized protein n=1 Tax=Profundibacter amoris TaxID=2171755 RepID=A0A347UES8_9RHOB|nr:hypothetical protein [Profundibacter amoris]AXX97356.1 hypothetical protein BAR1_05080 [Profundibacter amoris]